ncbi:MAG: hypothetical protein CVU49_02155 [Candidatus Cloacimonetes bacterium HGW-Cloacimonetes-2]|jgi:hypothetical protein|nr:MAG: hypothetical protein CVU49_02155 [Candidatus Cloacimonetes bacterium HGW-Cloacimonetes-2]
MKRHISLLLLLSLVSAVLYAGETDEKKLSLGAIVGFGNSVLGSLEDSSDWSQDDLGYFAPTLRYQLRPNVAIRIDGTRIKRSNTIELKQGLYTKGVLKSSVNHIPVTAIYEFPTRHNRNQYFVGGGIYFDSIVNAELTRRRSNGSELTTDVIYELPQVTYGAKLIFGSRFSRIFYSEIQLYSDLSSFDLQDLNQDNLRNSGFLILLGMDLFRINTGD